MTASSVVLPSPSAEAALAGILGPREVAIRGLSLADHPGWMATTLAEEIVRTGTDRHDPDRRSAWDDFYDGLGVELHAEPARVEADRLVSLRHVDPVLERLQRDLAAGPPVDRAGIPLTLDVISVYALDRLVAVPVSYPDGTVDRLTAYRFAGDPRAALLLVVLLRP